MFEMIFSKIDQLYNNIPYKIRKLISLMAIIIWFTMAIAISFYSFLKGKKEAPVVSRDTQFDQFKETIIKNQNTGKRSIILPDLNDLVKQEIPLQLQNIDTKSNPIPSDSNVRELHPEIPKNLPLISEEEELIFPKKQDPYNPPSFQYDFSKEFRDIDTKINTDSDNKNKLNIIKIEN